MSPRLPVPVRDIATRLPDMGRIRIGVKVPTKNGKSRPEKLDKFRLTSQDEQALQQVAAVYGGQVNPWNEPKAAPGQYEVITEARELRIALPPDPLGQTPIYELWSGGGCQRRCDGETCEMLTQGQDGVEMQQVPCLCLAKGALECGLHTRLSILLPEVRLGGTWRLDTKGSNAAHELPAMVDTIRSLQDKGIIRGTLRVQWRKQAVAGKTREFAVPVLGVDVTPDQLVAGQASLGQLSPAGPASAPAVASGTAGELTTGTPTPEPAREPEPPPLPLDPDDDVVDAEIIPDDRGVDRRDVGILAEKAFSDWRERSPAGQVTRTVERLRRAVTWIATDARTASLRECTPGELLDVWRRLERIEAGEVQIDADPWDDHGGVTFTVPAGSRSVTWSEWENT